MFCIICLRRQPDLFLGLPSLKRDVRAGFFLSRSIIVPAFTGFSSEISADDELFQDQRGGKLLIFIPLVEGLKYIVSDLDTNKIGQLKGRREGL